MEKRGNERKMVTFVKNAKEEKPLPKIGTKFMVNGAEYEVVYINEGQNRFSCQPCEGAY